MVEGGQVMYAAPQIVEAPQVQYVVQGAEQQQVQYVVQGAEQPQAVTYAAPPVQYIQGGQIIQMAQPQVVSYGASTGASVGASIAAPIAAPMVAGCYGRYGAPISHELFAKLAAGGSLTPEETAQLTGQPAPGASIAASIAAPIAAPS